MGLIPNIFTGQLDFTGTGGGGGGGPAERYSATFDATTSWSGPSGGNYSMVISQATHTRGTNPNIQVFELVTGNYQQIQPGSIEIDPSGDVTIFVNSSPDLRFAGAVLII